jgi:hypothetical protein
VVVDVKDVVVMVDHARILDVSHRTTSAVDVHVVRPHPILVKVDDSYILPAVVVSVESPMERIHCRMMFEDDTLVGEVAMYCLAIPNHCPFARYGPIDRLYQDPE